LIYRNNLSLIKIKAPASIPGTIGRQLMHAPLDQRSTVIAGRHKIIINSPCAAKRRTVCRY
jgi:hypothetical protein